MSTENQQQIVLKLSREQFSDLKTLLRDTIHRAVMEAARHLGDSVFEAVSASVVERNETPTVDRESHPRGLTLKEAAAEFGYQIHTLERSKDRPRSDKKHLNVDTTSKPYRVTRNEMRSWIERNTR